ncbi:trans-sulfuration enzyme family protein [Natronobacterium gregoryi]|uniref:Cystathionine gamma-synthase n=2 Tax=Natronobacterium gregoryi TaxID=44930 RepID=L0AMK9_NATGS|nr:PLP-dependent aspartate aminotransferase family protein [Natronobacterium gregoryi]AFZ74689.1 cystathionine beta-lyase/cystathionine gamma-synthase [Natronobacterium gregoryi SP2]ELY73406.1 cystathionine synthase/lyase [Natronobacterium gregoryi SP2]PLK20934.1 cystathionine gamma-synthase [Natronobacterium gregoryi SP2]SFJ04789.1 cystathionine gamma-synthase [Natronobacterium gregoryi]
MRPTDRTLETLAVAAGEEPFRTGSEAGDVTSPLHLSSTFALPGLDSEMSLDDVDPDAGEFVYSRLSNPTRHALEKRLAALEGGEHAMAFSSGTAAIFTTALAVVEPGDHLVAFDDLYAGTRRLLEEVFATRLDVDVSFVDATETENVAAAITDETAFVWMETPTNPGIELCDIAAIAEIADGADATFGVDNTFASSYFQRPLELGADVVAHSTTKYLNGHSDSVGGAVVTDDDALAERLEFLQQVGVGDALSPFDSYLVLRGLKTLHLRMRQHERNAMAIAEFLDDHDRVSAVHYPGLESHPQHDLACEQMDGFGGILSFELEGDIDDAAAFLESLEVFTLAVSVGGVESLIELPAGMTHEPLSEEEREELGITETLIRVSVGVEGTKDLIADLDRGFDAVRRRSAVADGD